MKVIKEQDHCLLLNYFGLDGRYYLAVTVMTYFDFKDPGNPLKEQEMWPFVQGELGKDAILDAAMPKPKGELLVWGRCFTPDGKARSASRVEVRIGPISKTLYIFGDRSWKPAGKAGIVISEPRPFTEMPLSYSLAFGGAGFDKNPDGKGIGPVASKAGNEIHPLPNIEDPEHLVGSPSDRPDPAGFAPLDPARPQRAKKLGTYDNKWFRERWPFFPDDMNWTYFNAAPEDQQTEEFFTGHEAFFVAGMHPKEPVIESRLPGIRHRLFVNQLTDVNRPDGETVFKEVLAHVDTVWLFPHAERGIAVSRGTAEVRDDEALDVSHLYIVSEFPGQQQGDIEKYHEQFKKMIDRAVAVDISAQMEDAKKRLTAVADMLRDLPLQISDRIAQNLGHAPKSVKTPVEAAIQSIAIIDQQKKLLAEGEKRILSLKADYGHLMKIETDGFATAAKTLDKAKVKLAAIPAKVDAIKKTRAENLKNMRELAKQAYGGISPAKLQELGIDMDALLDFKEEPGDPWHESGMRFIEECRDRLAKDPETMSAFRALGFRPYTLKRSWIGISSQEVRFERAAWGLKTAGKDDDPGVLVIPAGLVIPRFNGTALGHITIRALPPGTPTPERLLAAITDTKGDSFVEGSKGTAMALAPAEGKPFVCVGNDLEAILLHQELGDFCAIAAMEDPSVEPDKEAADAVKRAPQYLVVSYPDPSTGKAVATDTTPWKKLCANAEPISLPIGRNIIEAKRGGADLWQWVADALKPGIGPDPGQKPKEIDVMEPGAVASLIPAIDVAAIYKKVKEDLMEKMKPQVDLLEAKKKEGLDKLRKEMAKRGHNLDEIMKQDSRLIPEGANPYAAVQKDYAQGIAAVRQKLTQQGLMTPEIEAKLGEMDKTAQRILSDSAKRYDEGTKRLAEGAAKLEAGPPDWARKLMADAGIDPDDPDPAKPLTREEVIECHARGLSLSTKNLRGLDLSGLDLKGADLRQANLQGANLSGVNLDNADLRKAIAGEADMTGASLQGANLTMGIFQKAKFPGANMGHADLSQAMMSEADLTGADLSGATISKTLLEKAKLVKVRAVGANASQIYCLSADVSGADFSGADLTKAVFLKSNLAGADFSRSTLREANFLESKGDKLDFSGADMHNSRILLGSAITESNFSNTKADRASWMKSDLSGGDFRGSTMERSLLQECDLSGSNLAGITAKQARLTKSNLSDSNLEGINLFQGSLRKSKLVRTDLRRANLYGAEFYRTGVGETKLDEANLKMTKLYKRADLLPEAPKEKKK